MGSGCTKVARQQGRREHEGNGKAPTVLVGKTFDPSSFSGRAGSFGSQGGSGAHMSPEERRKFIEDAFTNLNLGSIKKAGRKFSLTDDDINKLMEVLEVSEENFNRVEIDAVLSNIVMHRRGTKRVSYTPNAKSIPEIQSVVSAIQEVDSQTSGNSVFTMESTMTLDPWAIAANINKEQQSAYSYSGASTRGTAGTPLAAVRSLPRTKSPTGSNSAQSRKIYDMFRGISPSLSEAELDDLVENVLEQTEMVSPAEFRRLIVGCVAAPVSPVPIPLAYKQRRSSTRKQREEARRPTQGYY